MIVMTPSMAVEEPFIHQETIQSNCLPDFTLALFME